MITLTLPEPKLHEFPLQADARQVRGGKKPTKLRGAVDLGEVISLPLEPSLAGDDAVLKHFLQQEGSGYRFHLLRLACGFRPGEGETFDQAWLEINLRREDGLPAPAPIAWSMDPRRLAKPVETTRTVKLGSKLEFLEGEIGVERKSSGERAFLEAFRAQEPRPFWEFKATGEVALAGSYLLHLVVRSPAAAPTGGEVSLSVGVKQAKYLLFYQEGVVAAHPALAFSLT